MKYAAFYTNTNSDHKYEGFIGVGTVKEVIEKRTEILKTGNRWLRIPRDFSVEDVKYDEGCFEDGRCHYMVVAQSSVFNRCIRCWVRNRDVDIWVYNESEFSNMYANDIDGVCFITPTDFDEALARLIEADGKLNVDDFFGEPMGI